ncbi:hypothetical protein G3O08_09425 [Cryomorpha ignava]|uniref:LPXTG cell wall anchor domain-containing protein n=1 Tax=Cryomorpha ignava TaxID=101383 RepID=A0A7K3WPY5_9FLAO|nr:hypothetical protein [Cryomorpha ignava]NEN23719.1 hypothetical protein [Cryomorpha ignava]
MKLLKKKPAIFAFCLLSVLSVHGQIPTHIDPGQNEKPVSIYQQPEFIIPILGLFVVLIGYYYFRKQKNK